MTGEAQTPGDLWPIPKFYFHVEFEGGITASFQDVSGLDSDAEVIEYRHGDSPEFSTIKMPEISKPSEVTLKKGMFSGDSALFDWFNNIKLNTIKRESVTIKLLDEAGNTTMQWTLANAFPIQIQGTDLASTSGEVAVESLVLQHEGMTISNS